MRQLKIGKQITNRETKSLEKYLHEVAGIQLICSEDEIKLTHLIKLGCRASLNRLIEANLRFVVSVAKQYQFQGLTLEDLINEGNLGLIKAAHRYDETRGFKFISYAVWWIRQSIIQALTDQARLIRLPHNRINALRNINKVAAKLAQKYEREPSNSELALLLETDEKSIADLLQASMRPISVDAPTQEDDETSLLSLLCDSNIPDPDNNLFKESLQQDVASTLTILSKREQIVLNHAFGLNGNVELSLEELAIRLDLTKERVRQIKDYAVIKLRKAKKSQRLKVYLG